MTTPRSPPDNLLTPTSVASNGTQHGGALIIPHTLYIAQNGERVTVADTEPACGARPVAVARSHGRQAGEYRMLRDPVRRGTLLLHLRLSIGSVAQPTLFILVLHTHGSVHRAPCRLWSARSTGVQDSPTRCPECQLNVVLVLWQSDQQSRVTCRWTGMPPVYRSAPRPAPATTGPPGYGAHAYAGPYIQDKQMRSATLLLYTYIGLEY